MKRYFENYLVRIGSICLFLVVISAIFAPAIAPYGIADYNVAERFSPPCFKHPFGTDHMGRDVFSNVVYGTRVTLYVSLLATLVAAAIGIPVGLISGYYGGIVDNFLMRVVDVMFAFPSLLLAISFVAFLGPSINNAILAIGVVSSASVARICRGQVLVCRESDYVMAARSIGSSSPRIMFKHILPNVAGVVIVVLTVRVAFAILTEAALSFVGLGVPPPTPSWGRLISTARDYVTRAPWMFLAPGFAIMLTTLSFNFIGDGLRDFLDPRLGHINRH